MMRTLLRLSVVGTFVLFGMLAIAQDKISLAMTQEELAQELQLEAWSPIATAEQDFEQDMHQHAEKAATPFYEGLDSFGNEVKVYADPLETNPVYEPWLDPEHPDFKGYPVAEPSESGKVGDSGSATTQTNVFIVADAEFRAAHSNWTSYCYSMVENADDAFNRDHSINWNVVSYWTWSSVGSTSGQILDNLEAAAAALGPGLVMGFTGKSAFTDGGLANVYNSDPGTGYSVMKDQSESGTTSVIRHEAGHNYSCSHDTGSQVCLMNYTYLYSIDYFDSPHDTEIAGNKNWFH